MQTVIIEGISRRFTQKAILHRDSDQKYQRFLKIFQKAIFSSPAALSFAWMFLTFQCLVEIVRQLLSSLYFSTNFSEFLPKFQGFLPVNKYSCPIEAF